MGPQGQPVCATALRVSQGVVDPVRILAVSSILDARYSLLTCPTTVADTDRTSHSGRSSVGRWELCDVGCTPLPCRPLGLKPTTGATRIALQVRDKAIQSVIGFVATTPVQPHHRPTSSRKSHIPSARVTEARRRTPESKQFSVAPVDVPRLPSSCPVVPSRAQGAW